MTTQKRKARRLKLWTENPHCHWCGKLTVITIKRRPDQATLDHLKHRLDPDRREFNRTSLFCTVLSCLQCNSARGERDHIKFINLRKMYETIL